PIYPYALLNATIAVFSRLMTVCNHRSAPIPSTDTGVEDCGHPARTQSRGGNSMSSTDAGARERHWEKTSNLNTLVMILLVIFSIIIPWMARPMNSIHFLSSQLVYLYATLVSIIPLYIILVL